MVVTVFLLMALGLTGLVVVAAVIIRARERAAWATFAELHGLTFTGAGWFETPALTGDIDGIPITVEREVRILGQRHATFTRVRALFRSLLPLGLEVTPGGLGGTFAKFFGGQDVPLGEPQADKALRIKGADPTAIRRLFANSTVLQAAMDFIADNIPDGAIRDSEVTLARPGLITDHYTLERLIRQAVATVQQLQAPLLPNRADEAPPLHGVLPHQTNRRGDSGGHLVVE